MTPAQQQTHNMAVQFAEQSYIDDDFAAVAVALAAKTVPQTDPTRRTSNWVTLTFTAPCPALGAGATEADLILGAMQGSTVPRVIAANVTLSNGDGIDLSNPITQGLIDALSAGGNWEAAAPGITARLKEFGAWMIAPWELPVFHAVELAPDAAAVAAAKAAKVADDAEAIKQQLIKQQIDHIHAACHVAEDVVHVAGDVQPDAVIIAAFTTEFNRLRT